MKNIFPEIIPAILVNSEKDFCNRLNAIRHAVSVVQVDIMDGTLVPPRSWADPQTIGARSSSIQYELHLMVDHPQPIINAWREHVPTLRRVIWHIEAPVNHAALLAECKQHGLETGLAIAPNTGLHLIELFRQHLDEILILGVHPGYSGQSLIASTLDNAQKAAQRFPNVVIGFDGGVSRATADEILATGVKRLYAASALFGAQNPQEEFKKFQTLLRSSL